MRIHYFLMELETALASCSSVPPVLSEDNYVFRLCFKAIYRINEWNCHSLTFIFI
jgi:hypothetical protein